MSLTLDYWIIGLEQLVGVLDRFVQSFTPFLLRIIAIVTHLRDGGAANQRRPGMEIRSERGALFFCLRRRVVGPQQDPAASNAILESMVRQLGAILDRVDGL